MGWVDELYLLARDHVLESGLLLLRIKIPFGIQLLGSLGGRICIALIFFHFDPLGVDTLDYSLWRPMLMASPYPGHLPAAA